MKITKNLLKEYLPHGSGINGDWHIRDYGDYFKAENFFDAMNDGYYVKVIDFSVIIPKKKPRYFNLHFHTNSSGWYWINNFMLRDYLEDTISMSIGNILER